MRFTTVVVALWLLASAAPSYATDSFSVNAGTLTLDQDSAGGLVEVVDDAGRNNVLFSTDAPPQGPCTAYTADDNSNAPRYDVACPTAAVQRVVVSGGSGADVISGIRGAVTPRICTPACPPPPATTPLSVPLTADGAAGNDTVTGTPQADTLSGGAGDDLISGLTGADALNGGDGFDTVTYSERATPVTAGPGGGGNDGSVGEADNIGADVESFVGGSGADTLSGDGGPNTLRGGPGNDTLDGGGGSDLLYGEADNDTLNAIDGTVDRVDCGDGTDTANHDTVDEVISCEDAHSQAAPPPPPSDGDGDGISDPSDACPDQSDIGASRSPRNGCPAPAADADGDGIPDSTDQCPLNSDLVAPRSPRNGCPAPLATGGNDTVNGTAEADLICGLGGSDILNGLGGDDTLFGDACGAKSKLAGAAAGIGGNDVLNGGDGNDKLYGGAGNDKLNGGPGTNTYSGGPGNDTINARNGKRETVDCGTGKKDRATVDKKDKTKGCERVKRAKK